MRPDQFDRFKNLTFDDFRRFANDASLSPHEKVGFPDVYREGREDAIVGDIAGKLPALKLTRQVVLDVGPGCSGVAARLIELCRVQQHTLLLADSKEMLDQLPDEPFIVKFPGYYPRDCEALLREYRERVNVLLTYSVLHYVFVEGNLFQFLDRSLTLLAPGGRMLIGDIPNVSKRKRFFASAAGVRFHQAFTGTTELPPVTFNTIDEKQIDDAVIFGLLQRCRASGYDAYVLPQAEELPMANRREDVLIARP